MKRADILILDGRHLLWRCVHAYGELSVDLPDGEILDTGAMYGFLVLAKKAHERYGGLVVVAWEAKTNFRLDLYPNYKGREDDAKRFKEMREALERGEEPDESDARGRMRFDLGASIQEQQEHLQILLKQIGIRQYFGTHCEADDVMATIAVGTAKRKRTAVIYSGDSDLFQAVRPGITVVKPGKRGEDDVFNARAVSKKTGVAPDSIPDLKAIAGDSSDKIPGITGIGDKGAVKLLEAFDTVEGVISAAESNDKAWPCSEKQRQTVIDQTDDLRLYLRLTTINMKAELSPKILPEPDKKGLMENFRKYHFSSFMKPSEMRAFAAMAGR